MKVNLLTCLHLFPFVVIKAVMMSIFLQRLEKQNCLEAIKQAVLESPYTIGIFSLSVPFLPPNNWFCTLCCFRSPSSTRDQTFSLQVKEDILYHISQGPHHIPRQRRQRQVDCLYSRLQKSFNKQAEQWKTTIDLTVCVYHSARIISTTLILVCMINGPRPSPSARITATVSRGKVS